jgi:hypothetical protein
MNTLPRFLYRGDSDKNNERKLRQTISSGVLLTSLSNGGNGKEIFTSDFYQLVNKHIDFGLSKSNFLSFTTNENTAFYYASKSVEFEEIYNFSEKWDFCVLTFDFNTLQKDTFQEYVKGLYYAEFNPICKEFYPRFQILLIDTYKYLKNKNNSKSYLNEAIFKAERDSEWLILPLNPFEFYGEFTSKLDINCITEKRIFRELQ